MPGQNKSILDQGYWEDQELGSKSESKPSNSPSSSPSSFPHAAKSLIDWVRPLRMSKTGGPRKTTLRRTAYLDGIRGFAAFVVYWHHHQLWSRTSINIDKVFEHGWGYDNQHYFACLPGIRLFFTGGHIAVSIFFIISGYVLSTKGLSLIQAGDFSKLSDAVGSALFRRWLRLYIPLIVTTFVFMSTWHVFGVWTDLKRAGNYGDEIWSWYCELKNFSFVFRSGGEPWFNYNFHLWSIPVEFKGSVLIYTCLMAFGRCTRNNRLWGEVALMYYFMYIADGWFCSMFMAGMFLADLDLLAINNNLPRWLWKLESFRELIFFNLFVAGVYLAGVPSFTMKIEDVRATPGWYYLSFLKPQAVFDYKWFYLFWASLFIVASIPHLPWLKSFFETRFCQYLGRISFALYLVHGPVLWILGDRLYAATGWSRESHPWAIPQWIDIMPLSKAGVMGMEPAFLVPNIICLPVTLWLAELVTTLVDEPSVKFSQWVYDTAIAAPPRI